jgi:hypothetical protein
MEPTFGSAEIWYIEIPSTDINASAKVLQGNMNRNRDEAVSRGRK